MAVIVSTPLEPSPLVRRVRAAMGEPGEPSVSLHAATLDAIDAVNIAAGEFALTLEPDDPRARALLRVQDGLDALWRESGGPDHERENELAPVAA